MRRPFMATAAARQLADIAVSPTQAFYREVATSTLRCECVKQSLSLIQIERLEALGEPAVDRGEKLAGLLPLALIAPEPRHAHCRANPLARSNLSLPGFTFPRRLFEHCLHFRSIVGLPLIEWKYVISRPTPHWEAGPRCRPGWTNHPNGPSPSQVAYG